MKYKLINKTTGEEHICYKAVIDGWDYFVSYVYGKPTIATNNPNHHIPKVVDETWIFFKEVDGTCEKDQYEHWLYKSGYNKSQETHPFSGEDMIDFYEWIMEEDPIGSTPEILQLWKEQKPKTLYYE